MERTATQESAGESPESARLKAENKTTPTAYGDNAANKFGLRLKQSGIDEVSSSSEDEDEDVNTDNQSQNLLNADGTSESGAS